MSNFIKNMIWPVIILGFFVAIIYYRAFLFTADFNKPVDMVLNDASESIEYNIPSYKLAAGEESIYNQIFGSDPATDTAENIAHSHPELAYVEVDVVVPAESASVEEEQDLKLDDIVSAVKDTVNETLEVFMEENEPVSDTDSASVLTASELLFKARLAYWNRDLKTAEDTYIQLTEMSNDPNAFGELGNLYYMQSQWKKASDAYYHAAVQLKKLNHMDQAQHLLRIIRGLDTETANKLQTELQQS